MSYRTINAVLVECDGPHCTEAITVRDPSDVELFGWRIGVGAYGYFCPACVEHISLHKLREPASA